MIEDAQEATLPFAPEAEAAVLLCLIENPTRFQGLVWEANLGEEYFHGPATRALWALLSSRLRNGQPIDPALIGDEIRDRRAPGLSSKDFSDILLTEAAPESWSSYVETLRDRYARRVLLQAGRLSADHNEDGATTLQRVRDAAAAATEALAGSSAVLESKAAVQAFLNSLTDRYNNGDLPGMGTGIPQIDEKTGGLRPGELWVVGAPTSAGKSVFMLQVAGHALREGKRVAIFSLEMGADEIVARLISCHWFIPIRELMHPRHTRSHTMAKIGLAADELKTSGLLICDRADLSMEVISGYCQRLSESAKIDLVVIDYLQLVSAPRVKGQNREQEVAGISRACKQLAKRLKCPVITATQLNEQGKSRESRAIEQDADCVLLFSAAKDDSQTMQFWKCRNGKRGETLSAKLSGETQRFTFN